MSIAQFPRFVGGGPERHAGFAEWQDAAWIKQERLPTWREALALLHTPSSEADLAPSAPSRRRLAFDELLAHQLALGRRRSARQAQAAPVILPGEASEKLRAALPFTLTGAQDRALTDIRGERAAGVRMSRLLHGDVGSGKTVVAALAMADATSSHLQAALMAPPELLR